MTYRFHIRLVYWNLFILLLVVIVLGNSFSRSLVALVAGLAVTVLVARALKMRLAQPLEETSIAARRIAEGDFQQKLAVTGDEEIADLMRDLNAAARNFSALEKDLTERRRKVESVVAAMGEGVMVLDSGGRITLSNRSLRDIIGTDRDPAGKTTLDIFRHPELEASVKTVLAGSPPKSVEVALSGNRLAVAHVAGIPNLSGVVDSAVVVFHDLTDIRRTERMRRDFVANVSHEFKTPLTAIRGYTETLLGGAVDNRETTKEFLEIIERNARHLESLVSDLLTLARLEAELPASLETVNMRSLVEEQISSRQNAIADRNLRVMDDCPEVELHADRIRLTAAVSNLIDNAVHYNRPEGEIQITGAQENGSFVLTIADTGDGIPPADLQRIFERFYRVDKSRTRESGGTGLGLAIVKHAIESQGGSITVASKLGAGSKFSIRLPMSRREG